MMASRGMSDFLAALGLVFVIEGLIFAAFPGHGKKAVESLLHTPTPTLRIIGVASAVVGVLIVWAVRS